MYKKIIAVVGLGSLALVIGGIGYNMLAHKNDSTQLTIEEIHTSESEKQAVDKGVTIAIDPGHGGYDPGKVGINGALEKDINLQISCMVEAKLSDLGYQVIMTRVEDVQVQSVEESFSKSKDLDARVEIINQQGIDLAISVHQNSYTAEEVKGAQVFYYTSSQEGEAMAAVMQESLREVDPENHRQIKANDSYYLLRRTTTPTIIVECGFLSNTNEANMLIDMTYQNEMAEAIVRGIENYLESL